MSQGSSGFGCRPVNARSRIKIKLFDSLKNDHNTEFAVASCQSPRLSPELPSAVSFSAQTRRWVSQPASAHASSQYLSHQQFKSSTIKDLQKKKHYNEIKRGLLKSTTELSVTRAPTTARNPA